MIVNLSFSTFGILKTLEMKHLIQGCELLKNNYPHFFFLKAICESLFSNKNTRFDVLHTIFFKNLIQFLKC
jgi:hypothetical protein